MNTSIFDTLGSAQPATFGGLSSVSLDALQTIDLAQLESITGANGFTDWLGHVGHNALNLGKAAANGVVNTINWALPKTLDVNLAGVIKGHWEPPPVGKPFRDDPLSKIGHYSPPALPPGH